jgi:hypothetical protein
MTADVTSKEEGVMTAAAMWAGVFMSRHGPSMRRPHRRASASFSHPSSFGPKGIAVHRLSVLKMKACMVNSFFYFILDYVKSEERRGYVKRIQRIRYAGECIGHGHRYYHWGRFRYYYSFPGE